MLRKNKEAGRVLEAMPLPGRPRNPANPVIEHQPTVRRQNRRSAATDLQPLPRLNGAGQPMMRTEVAQMIWTAFVHAHLAIGDPDALPASIDRSGLGVTSRFMRMRSGEEGAMQDGSGELAAWIGNSYRKEERIFVIHVIEVQAVRGLKGGEVGALPVEQILRKCQCNARAMCGQSGIGHDIAFER